MMFLLALLACTGLWMVFPKAFKFMVGTWVGFCGGGFFWAIMALCFHGLITMTAFLAFIIAGIIAGCVLAAKG